MALGATFPLARVLLHPSTSLPGSSAGDIYKHVWPYWHSLAVFSQGTWPHTRFLSAPDGGVLLDVMLLPSILMAPVTLLAGPVLAANLWVWLSLLAIGLATYAMCLRFTGSYQGSLLAGLLAQTTPYILGHGLTSGVHERLVLWVFPMLILGLDSQRRGGRRLRSGLFVTLLVAFMAIHNPTFSMYAVLLCAGMLPVLLWPMTPARLPFMLRRLVPIYLSLAGTLLACFLIIRWFVTKPGYLAEINQERVATTIGISSPTLEVATLATVFDPWAVHQQQPKLLDDELYNLCYLGWIPLLVILSGAVMAWRRGHSRSLGILGLGTLFLAMSLGPMVQVGSSILENPFYLTVVNLVPFWGGLPAVWEFVSVFAILASIGVAEFMAGIAGGTRAWLVAGLILAGTLLERVVVLPVPLLLNAADAHVSDIYSHAVGEGNLADLPRMWRGTDLSPGPMFLAQTSHHHPIPATVNLRLTRWRDYQPLMSCVSDDWSLSVACFASRDFRWLVIHRDWFKDEESASACVQGLSDVLGAPVAVTEQEYLFDLSGVAPDPVGEDCP